MVAGDAGSAVCRDHSSVRPPLDSGFQAGALTALGTSLCPWRHFCRTRVRAAGCRCTDVPPGEIFRRRGAARVPAGP